jgi:hypothetical protein
MACAPRRRPREPTTLDWPPHQDEEPDVPVITMNQKVAVGVVFVSVMFLIGVGATHISGHVVHPNPRAYHLAFATASLVALAAVGCALMIRDRDLAETMVRMRRAPRAHGTKTAPLPKTAA